MKTFSLAMLSAVVLALISGSSHAAALASCNASLTFDTFSVETDTDQNPPFTNPDQWTIHVYAYVNGVLGKVNPHHDGGVTGDSGAVKTFDTQMISNAVVGQQGDPVNFKIVGKSNASRIKEMDPSSRPGSGVSPADVGIFSLDETIPSCTAGTYSYPLDVTVHAKPGGVDGEHDGLIGLRFTLTLN